MSSCFGSFTEFQTVTKSRTCSEKFLFSRLHQSVTSIAFSKDVLLREGGRCSTSSHRELDFVSQSLGSYRGLREKDQIMGSYPLRADVLKKEFDGRFP